METEEGAVVDVLAFGIVVGVFGVVVVVFGVVVGVFGVVVGVFDVVLVVLDVVFEVDEPADEVVADPTADDAAVVALAELIVGGTPPHALATTNNPRDKARAALLQKSGPRTNTPFSHTCASYHSTRPNRWCRANAAAATDC